MTDTGQMTLPIEARFSRRTSERREEDPLIEVIPAVRLVQPGSWNPCTRCRRAIEFVPGGRRTLVALTTYANEALQSVELFHVECYDDAVAPGC